VKLPGAEWALPTLKTQFYCKDNFPFPAHLIMAKQKDSKKQQTPQRAKPLASGARESNAGDDFHFLWASRRAVQLINPNSDLSRLVVEGVTPADLSEVRATEDLLLGVDLTEYYGGENFRTARQVIVSQLKYSTRHPHVAWTVGRLCASQKNQASVIQRLAEIYCHFREFASQEEVLSKLSIQLVSNQPTATNVKETLQRVKRTTGENRSGRPLSLTVLLRTLSTREAAVVRRLHQSSKLAAPELGVFLSVLSLESTGTESREIQRIRLIQDLGPSISYSPVARLRELYELIQREAQPGREQSPGLTSRDVLACLGVSNSYSLFPAPTSLKPTERLIATHNVYDVLALLRSSQSEKLLLHGSAGVGKTTTVELIPDRLPPGSVSIVYDCFAEGSYLDPGTQRHTPKRALVQIANELAVKCGVPFLIQPPQDVADLQREFRIRLEAAAKIVSQTSGALLLIVIDAADNAIIAANTLHETSFVPDLWKVPLPNGCRLVMSARTHRRQGTEPPGNVAEYEIQGFTPRESALHLRLTFPGAQEEECQLFHERTSGNPRVQHYVLTPQSPPSQKLTLDLVLEKANLTPDEIFLDLYQAAVQNWTRPSEAQRYLATLIGLTRPAPLNVFASSCGTSPEEARSFCLALDPGLLLEGDTIAFRDEDFEAFLRGKISPADMLEAHKRLGKYFLQHAQEDEYAARSVVEHLFAAGDFDAVIRLTIDGPEPTVVSDQLRQLQIRKRRIELAMQAATRVMAGGDAVRLILLAGEEARADSAIGALIRKNPGLAALFGDAATVTRLYLQEESRSWLGPAHLRTAALLARFSSERDRALGHFRDAEAWLRRRSSLPENEQYAWQIDAGDIAAGAEAIFWFGGFPSAYRWLRRWRPEQAILSALRLLTLSLANQVKPQHLFAGLRQTRVPVWISGVILASLWEVGVTPPRRLVEETAEHLVRMIDHRRNLKKLAEGWPVSFCELLTALKMDRGWTLRIASALGPPFPTTQPNTDEDLARYDLPLRIKCLEAVLSDNDLTIDDLMPKAVPSKGRQDNGQRSSDRYRYEEAFGKILPLYMLRARSLKAGLKTEKVTEAIKEQLKTREALTEYRWFRFDRQYSLWTRRLLDILTRTKGDATELLEQTADLAERMIKVRSPRLWLEMAEMLIRHEQYRSLANRLIERAAKFVVETPFSRTDRWELLLDCSDLTSQYDRSASEDYYRRALEAAEGIDDESAWLLSFQAHIAHQLAAHPDQAKARALAGRQAQLLEAHEAFVTETVELPWEGTLRAACALDPATAYALLSRWDDEDRLSIRRGIVPLVDESLRRDFLLPLQALGLLRLSGQNSSSTGEIIAILDKLRAGGPQLRRDLLRALETVSLWIRRDIAPEKRKDAATAIVEWADKFGLGSLNGIPQLRELANTVGPWVRSTQEEPYSPYWEQPSDEAEVMSIIQQAHNGSLAKFTERLETVAKKSRHSGKHVTEFLTNTGNSLVVRDRLPFLEALVQIDPNRLLGEYLVNVLCDFLTQWQGVQAVRNWTEIGLRLFLERHLPSLVAYEYDAEEKIRKLLSLPMLDQTRRLEIFLPSIATNLWLLGPRSLYMLAQLLADGLPQEELLRILDWSNDRAQARIVENGGQIPAIPVVSLENSRDVVLANFLWPLFGHPDKEVRWEALHAARAIFQQPHEALIWYLLDLSKTETAGPFRSPQREFFWISARAWFLLLLLRLADEHPQMLTSHVRQIADYASSTDFPHAQIRELAKRTILRVAQKQPQAVPQPIVDEVAYANTARACILPRGESYSSNEPSPGNTRGGTQTLKFQFDALDTIPYWFEPLAHVFGNPTPSVTERADIWVSDKWGRTEADWWNDPRELGKEDRSLRMYPSHGTIPSYEGIRVYIEYHAMLCVAGEMVDSLPVAISSYDPPDDPWQEWLERHIQASEDYWLADLRSPTPLSPEFWGKFPAIENWLRKDQSSDFDAALGLQEANREGWIVVSGSVEVGNAERRGSVYVVSSLVNPTYCRSLLHALQAAELHSYALPVENWGVGDAKIEEEGFELEPWLTNVPFSEGLDKYDPFARLGTSSLNILNDDFRTQMGVTVSSDNLKFTQASGTLVVENEIWNDNLEETRERITRPYSTGRRLWIRVETLLEYLRRKNRSLIVQVQISRNRSASSRPAGEAYDPESATIYIIHQDGTIESVDGHRTIGQTHS
jgi:hypothetical protein